MTEHLDGAVPLIRFAFYVTFDEKKIQTANIYFVHDTGHDLFFSGLEHIMVKIELLIRNAVGYIRRIYLVGKPPT